MKFDHAVKRCPLHLKLCYSTLFNVLAYLLIVIIKANAQGNTDRANHDCGFINRKNRRVKQSLSKPPTYLQSGSLLREVGALVGKITVGQMVYTQ